MTDTMEKYVSAKQRIVFYALGRRSMKKRVLVFGDDTRSFLAVVRSLARQGIEVHTVPFNRHAPALWSRYITEIHQMPKHDGSDRWLRALQQLLSEYSFDLIIPCCDRSILCLDAHRGQLDGVPMALPSPQILASLFDKLETRRLAEKVGVSVPSGRLLRSDDTSDDLIREFGLPLLIKARSSYLLEDLDHRRPVTIVRDEAQLQSLLRTIGRRQRFLVEEYFEGTGVGISVIAHEGRILCGFQHGRLKEPRSGGGSSLRQSEFLDTGLMSACRKMAKASHLNGVAMFEFRVHRPTGRWILVEVNARFWGSLPLPVALGVDFPYYLFQLLVYGKEVGQVSYRTHVRCRNLAINAYDVLLRDTEFKLFSMKKLGIELLDLFKHPVAILFGIEKSDTFQRDDLLPAFTELFLLPYQAVSSLIRRKIGFVSKTPAGKLETKY